MGLAPSRLLAPVACSLFVTWKCRANGAPSLRGCIGCLKPLPITSLRDYALTSALRDQRFDPIEPRELPQLSCTVSLLTHFERARDAHDWEVGSHGVLIDFDDPSGVARSGVYLPEVMVEQGWSRQQTIDSLIRKAGFKHTITDQLRHSLRLPAQARPQARRVPPGVRQCGRRPLPPRPPAHPRATSAASA